MYGHLRDIQGHYIPVCVGLIDLIEPYYYDCGVFKHFMFLSYAGRPVLRELRKVEGYVIDQILAALEQLHKYRVLHHDAEPRNVLYDKRTNKCIIVDLMLAESYAGEALRFIDINGQDRKTNWELEKQGKDAFAAEARSLLASLSYSGKAEIPHI
jgi:tRNA A-37 threonylcarbamoyl transferase component Bud32